MTASFATLSFPPSTQRPISFVHYSGPKEISKSTTIRASGDNGAIDDSLVQSAETCPSRETVEPSGPASREPPTVAVDDECFETHGVTERDGSERSAIDEALAERGVSTDADQVATSQDNWKRRGSLSSVLRCSASRQRTPSARSVESNDAEFDYLFNSPIETQDPASPIRSSRSCRSRSSSESDLDLDISDENSPHISSRQPKNRRKCSYSEQSGETFSFRPPLSESSMGTSKEHRSRLLYHSGPRFFTPNKRSRQHRKSRGDVRSLAGVFVPRMRLRDRNTKISPQEINNLRTSRRDSHAQLAPGEPRGTRDTDTTPRLDRSTSGRMESGNYAQEQFGRGACGGLISQASSTSVSSGSLGLAHVQSVVAACQSGQPGARDICVQSISPELSFLIFTVPHPMSLKALMYPQDDHGSAASLGCYGGLENIIVKQIQSAMWLVAGTVRSSEVSCADPKQKDDLMDPSNGETDSAYGNISDDYSNSPGEQFLEKNQRWSPEDDRILRKWVENGRPWSWITRQFPMRTPGSVRTRYSMLRRKPTQS